MFPVLAVTMAAVAALGLQPAQPLQDDRPRKALAAVRGAAANGLEQADLVGGVAPGEAERGDRAVRREHQDIECGSYPPQRIIRP